MILENKNKILFFYFFILLHIYSCNNKQGINVNQISNRSLVQAYVDTVLNNIYATRGMRNNTLLQDTVYIKSINSTIYFTYGNSPHPTNYKLIIDDSSKNIYKIRNSVPYLSNFIYENLQIQLLEQKTLFQWSFNEDLTFADLEIFLNDNCTFRNKFPEREILDSILSIDRGYSFGKRVYLESQIDSFFEDWLNGAKIESKNIQYGDPDIRINIPKFENYIEKIKPLLKQKLSSKFVLMYAGNGIKYLEINPYNNYERKIFFDQLNQRTIINNGEIDSARYKKDFEREFFNSAFGKRSLYNLTAFTIGFNLYNNLPKN